MTPGFGRGFFCGAPESLLGKAVAYTPSQWPKLMRDLAEPARANGHEPMFYLRWMLERLPTRVSPRDLEGLRNYPASFSRWGV